MGWKRLTIKEIDEFRKKLESVRTENPYLREQIHGAVAYLGNIADEMEYHAEKYLRLETEE